MTNSKIKVIKQLLLFDLELAVISRLWTIVSFNAHAAI